MKYGLLIGSVAALFFIGGAQATVSAQGSLTDAIWDGLWNGVNLHIPSVHDKSPNSGDAPVRPKPPVRDNRYVALGDSVAAGVGLPTVVSVPAAEQRCGRTAEAYPYSVARAVNLPLTHVACSGATAGDLLTKQRSGSPNLPAQLSTAFAPGTPRLITITAGANDVHWVNFLSSCYYSNCATDSQTTVTRGLISVMRGKLYAALSGIELRSGGVPPRVVVTGYYNPVSAACTTQYTTVTAAEVQTISIQVEKFNAALQQTASSFSFARFAPVDFSGHDICSSDSWIQGRNDPQPFHPTVEGQNAIANSVISVINSSGL